MNHDEGIDVSMATFMAHQTGVAEEREATFKWLLSNTFLSENIDQHSTLMERYVRDVLKPVDPASYLAQLFRSVDPVQQERERIIELLEANRQPCDCGDACEQFDAGFDEAIALIKGQNK
jgi:hypothetical protein